MPDTVVKLEFAGTRALITIDRPAQLNALNSHVIAQLGQAIAEVRNNPRARSLIITGAGERAFVAGADIAQMRDFTPAQARTFSTLGQKAFQSIEELPIPSIAAVNGYALGGGCELALACDIRIASANARFGQPEVGLGIIPGFGGTVRLPRAVGAARARELVLTGRIMRAEEALACGLVSEVVSSEELMDRANALAAQLAAKSRVALAAAKAVSLACDESYRSEAEEFARCFATDHPREGMSAYLERREASFS